MDKKIFPRSMLIRAIGANFLLLSFLFFLSPYGMLNALGYGVIWLFGYAGYYFLLPLLALFGGHLLFCGRFPPSSWRLHLSFLSLFLALAFLFGLLSCPHYEASLADLMPSFKAAFNQSQIAYSIIYSGGVPFTSLVGGFIRASFAIPLVITIVLFLAFLSFALLPSLIPLMRKMSLKAANKKKIRQSEKAIEKEEKESFAYSSYEEKYPSHEQKEEALPSRAIKNSSYRFDSPIIPKEIETPLNNYRPAFEAQRNSGLVEAKFQASSADNPIQPSSFQPMNEEKKEEINAKKEERADNFIDEAPSPIVKENVQEEKHDIPVSSLPKENFIEREETVVPNNPSIEPVPSESITPITPSPSCEERQEESPIIDETIAYDEPVIEERAQQEEPISANAPTNIIEEMAAASSPVTEKTEAPMATSAPEEGTWTAPPAHPTTENLLDNLGIPHKKERKSYNFPPVDLLKEYPPSPEAEQEKLNCERRKQLIDGVFNDFGVGAHVEDFTIGPSVTRYNIKTDPDVSVSSLNKHIKDIAIRLNGMSIRFEEIVRGRSTSGLEVPNERTETVSLRRMVSALPNREDKLYVPFGVDIDNKAIFSDLAAFPHLLTAGTTGSGKSVFITGLIMSLIMLHRPEDLKLVLVDPKRVEMSKYHDLPHLLCPIIKEPSEAKVCLDKLIVEMERRYKAFEYAGVKDIGEWNKEFAPDSKYATMPYIVVFIDEYADLSDTCKNIGEAVVRLAQKARAAGIHLVIATQRPSVSVITGTIKANINVRVALSMSSAIDSQTILGQGGAEELIGHGDMLVDCSLIARMGFTRCQGCYCDGHEINAVCDFIRSQMPPDYNSDFLDLVDHEAERQEQEEMIAPLSKAEARAQSADEMYQSIKEHVMQREYESISHLQRTFGIGFPRAGKIFARLQQEGIVAMEKDAPSSSKGCRVLIHRDPNEPSSDIKLAGDND